MFRESFHSALAKARTAAKFSLRALGSLVNIDHRRLHSLETGELSPKASERELLANALISTGFDLISTSPRPGRFYQRLKSRGLRFSGTKPLYLPPADRSSRIRFFSAMRRFGPEMKSLCRVIKSRVDYDDVNALCEIISLGSSLECLFLTTLLAEGAEPTVLAPHSVEPRLPHDVVCPVTGNCVGFRPFPALLTKQSAVIIQVTFATPRRYTVDMLQNIGQQWRVLEIDGLGHDTYQDERRNLDISLPVLRISEQDVLNRANKCVRSSIHRLAS